MAKSSDTFSKREKEKKRLQKRKEKEQRKEDKKANAKESKSFEDMLAYVDEYGNISATPPDPSKKKTIKEADINLGARNKGESATSFSQNTGKVKFYNASKGFGFIKGDQRGEDIFFHAQSANFAIQENDKVTFETEMGVKGLAAIRITKVS